MQSAHFEKVYFNSENMQYCLLFFSKHPFVYMSQQYYAKYCYAL